MDVLAPPRSRERTRLPAPTVVLGLVAVFWLVLPLTTYDTPAQDGLPFIVAARLAVHGASDGIYVRDGMATEEMARTRCEVEERCSVAPFVSPPPAVALVMPLGVLPPPLAQFFIRLLGVLACVVAMFVLDRRLAAVPDGRLLVAISALALTPLVYAITIVGQNSPALFLLAVLPVAELGRRGQFWAGLLLAAVICLKVFPAVLLVIGWSAGRRLLVTSAVGAVALLAAIATAVAGGATLGGFLDFGREWSVRLEGTLSNGSLGALSRLAFGVSWPGVVLAAAVLAAATWVRPRLDVTVLWPIALLGILLLHPQVWTHYLFVGVAAVAAACLQGDRWHVLIPGAAVATVPAVWFLGQQRGPGTVVSIAAALVIAFLAANVVVSGRWSAEVRAAS